MFRIIDHIGFLGPFILILLTIYYFLFISHTISFIFVYILGYLVNMTLNFVLKNMIRESRPVDEKSFLPIERLSIDTYGMPSGHAQSVWYSTMMFMLNTSSYNIIGLSIVISCITIYQRYSYRNHTLNQLIAGSIVGMFMAWLTTFTFKKYAYKYNFQA